MSDCSSIHAAVRRYLSSYRRQFTGSEDEYQRLHNLTVEKLRDLEATAPLFYRNKLPTLFHQAATRLGLSRTKEEVHNTHRIFLLILDSLMDSQPNGELAFELEKRHIETIDKLHKSQKELRAKERELMAAESDIYNDSQDSTFSKLIETRFKLFKVSKLIAKHHHLREEEDTPFVLTAKLGQGLYFLQQTDRGLYDNLEEGLQEILSKRKKGRSRRDLPNKVIVSEMLKNCLGTKVKPDDAKQILEEVYGAVTDYFRDINKQLTEEQHSYYIKSNYLLPKEGDILSDPDSVPPEVLYQLNKNAAMGEEKMNRIFDQFALKRRAEDGDEESRKILASQNGPIKISENKDKEENSDYCESSNDDENEEEDEESSDEESDEDDVEILDIGVTNQQMKMFARVKEEPVDHGYDLGSKDLESLLTDVEPPRPNVIEVRRTPSRSQPTIVKSQKEKETAPVHEPADPTLRPESEPIAGGSNCGSVWTDPFLEMEMLLAEQEKTPEEESSGSQSDEEDEGGDSEEDCEVIKCVDKNDKIQMVDILDDD